MIVFTCIISVLAIVLLMAFISSHPVIGYYYLCTTYWVFDNDINDVKNNIMDKMTVFACVVFGTIVNLLILAVFYSIYFLVVQSISLSIIMTATSVLAIIAVMLCCKKLLG